MHIAGSTLDDVLKRSLEAIIARGETLVSSRGKNRELRGVLLKLTNPRARLSHSEKRCVMFSPLGELAWYLAGSNGADFIAYYIRDYKLDAEDDGTLHGAYGPRLFSDEWNQQFNAVAGLLRDKPSTRRAVIQLYDSRDLVGTFKEVPCTTSMQFMIRNEKLDLVVSMRSNDAFKGLPHDIFTFTMLQEIMGRTIACEIGEYIHFAGSLHLYEGQDERATRYVAEGWQATVDVAMPPMPSGDPWPQIRHWLNAESAIRSGKDPSDHIRKLNDYWKDLAGLLQVYRCYKVKSFDLISRIRNEMDSSVYKEYIYNKEKRN